MRVLLVEDDPGVREALELGLSLEGHEVRAVDRPEEALGLLSWAEVVILDVLLPQGDGFSLLRAIRERSEVPVLMLTALDGVEWRVKGLREGADDYLVKPYSLQELLARLEALGQGGAGGPVAYLGERALFRCLEVLKGLEVQAFYREGPDLLVLLGRERPLLVLALEGGRLWPHPRPPRGRPLPKRPFPFLRELTLAPWAMRVEGEYRCFVLHRGRVVGILRLDQDLRPLPLF